MTSSSNNSPQRRLWVSNSSFTRRRFLAGAGGAAAVVALASCSGGGTSPSSNKSPSGTPKRGGDFRFGMAGGGSKDRFDGQNGNLAIDVARLYTAFESLLILDENFELAYDGLAESVDVDSPTQYTFRLRQGIEFHNGKTLTADDVLYSLRRIGSTVGFPGHSATASIDLAAMKKLDKYTVRVPLKEADSILLLNLATAYLFGIVPEGYEGFSGDVSTQAGTGPYKLKSFTPGQESVHERNPNYWRDGQPYLDTVTITNFSDTTAQVNALLGQQIHATVDLPSAQIATVKAGGAQVLESPAGATPAICMHIDDAPFDDVRVRQAFRLIPDRQSMLDQVFAGHGSLGNDTYQDFTTDLPQRAQDIAKAKELLKAAGHENLTIELSTTPYTPGQLEICTIFAQHAKEAGVTVNAKNVPGDQYWSDVAHKTPFYTTSYVLKPYLAQATQRSISGALYPDTHWPPKTGPGSEYMDLYRQALSATDDAERIEIEKQMNELEYKYGGYIIPVIPNKLDAHASNVQGLSSRAKTAHPFNDFAHGFRAIWFA